MHGWLNTIHNGINWTEASMEDVNTEVLVSMEHDQVGNETGGISVAEIVW